MAMEYNLIKIIASQLTRFLIIHRLRPNHSLRIQIDIQVLQSFVTHI